MNDSQRPGDRLRQMRLRLGITTREVEEISRAIAAEHQNSEFIISHARLIQVENDQSTPSIYKLFSLSLIYHTSINRLLSMYIDFAKGAGVRLDLARTRSHLVDTDFRLPEGTVAFPIRFDPGVHPNQTNLLSRMVQVWGHVPAALLDRLSLRTMKYGYIGLDDYTMHPLLRPGSFIQVDDRQRKPGEAAYRTEFDRPIYFVELRDRYVCCWCELRRGRIVLIPYPLSPCGVEEHAYPTDAEIVGRVTAVAARIVNYSEQTGDGLAESPARPEYLSKKAPQ